MIKGIININVLNIETHLIGIFKNIIFIYRKGIYIFYKLLK